MKALSLLIKPASGNCNMRCRYCFYSDVADIRETGNLGIMSREVLETVVRKALSETSQYCVFGFQGGEPTLAGLDFYKRLIELEKKYNINNVRITNTIQTNGSLIDDEWAEFFSQNNFLLGLSIDANKQVHDELRFDAAGKGTHNACLKAARLLRRHKVEFNILSVVTRYLAAHPDSVFRFYKQNDFRYIQFIPCLDGLKEQRGSRGYSLDPKSFSNFLCRTFDLWYEDYSKDDYYSIRSFDNYIHILAGRHAENCAMNGSCTVNALIEANGDVYPCDFYAIDEHLLGNVKDFGFAQMFTSEKGQSFVELSLHVDPRCKDCEYYFICRGGCRRDREPVVEGRLSRNYYCESYKAFFQHALPRMLAIAKRL